MMFFENIYYEKTAKSQILITISFLIIKKTIFKNYKHINFNFFFKKN